MTKRFIIEVLLISCLAILVMALQPNLAIQASKLQIYADRTITLPGSFVRYSSPVLANLDADDDLEIVVGGSDGLRHAGDRRQSLVAARGDGQCRPAG